VQSGWFNSEVMLYMAFVAVANYTQPNFEMGYAFPSSLLLSDFLNHIIFFCISQNFFHSFSAF
jgi:hypothetical protein